VRERTRRNFEQSRSERRSERTIRASENKRLVRDERRRGNGIEINTSAQAHYRGRPRGAAAETAYLINRNINFETINASEDKESFLHINQMRKRALAVAVARAAI
jgi:hypothetical protein